MRYWKKTLSKDEGMILDFEGIPFENRSHLEKRLYDPRPFAPDEWSPHATALYDEQKYQNNPPARARRRDNYSFGLYPVISPRFKALLEQLLQPDEIEFLPVQMRGYHTGYELGTYYIPHLLKSYDCLDHETIRRQPIYRLFADRIPPDARAFIAPDEVHNKLVFREDIVQAIQQAGLRGIDFSEMDLDTDEPEHTLPLGAIFFATVEEQQAWLAQALAEGAYGVILWQRWHNEDDQLTMRTSVAPLRTPEDVNKVPWHLTPEQAAHTIKLTVYLSRKEWRRKTRLKMTEGEWEGGLMTMLDMDAIDATGQAWYGRFEVGAQVGSVLLQSGWFLPFGWRDAPPSEFEPLYAWWEALMERWRDRCLEGVSVRSGDREQDEYRGVTEGAARWWLQGGDLRVRWDGRPVQLRGRALRRLKREIR
jgi:hypothetical protein